MELKRAAWVQLEDWWEHHQDQALLVTGARQVGKTFLITQFLQQHEPGFATFDLLADTVLAQSLRAAHGADDIMLRLSAASRVPLQEGQTAIFIDEVQAVPELVTQIKYLVLKYRYRFVLSGSLLGVELENIKSLPVGYVHTVSVYPLDLSEFFDALGGTAAMQQARQAFLAGHEIPDFVHTRLMDLFHRYLLVGGMPAAVSDFIDHNNMQTVRQIQRDINLMYSADISKYAPQQDRLTIQHIFDLIPSQLAQSNRRFQFSAIPEVKRFHSVSNQFLWLIKAGVAIEVNKLRVPVAPLLAQVVDNKFKLFSSDIGLLTSQYSNRLSLQILSPGIEDPAGFSLSANLGSVYENFVAQQLMSQGFRPFYFAKQGIGELDFLVETRDGDVIAFEVKSGKNYLTHKALNNALAQSAWHIDQAIVLAETNLKTVEDITYIPLYLLPVLRND